jgi:hypothetical protein
MARKKKRYTTLDELFAALTQRANLPLPEGAKITIAFRIDGPKGGEFAMILRQGGAIIEPGRRDDAQLVIGAQDEALLTLANDGIPIDWALRRGMLRLNGDIQLASTLMQFLA